MGKGRRAVIEIAGKKVPPAERMTYRSKWVSERAKGYLAWKESFAALITEWMYFNGWRPFKREPLGFEAEITMPSGLHRQDLDNQVKALLDAAQLAGLFPSDGWFDRIAACRKLGSEWFVRMVFEELR